MEAKEQMAEHICERCHDNQAEGECSKCGDYICDLCSSHKTGIDYVICQECLAHDEWMKSEHYANLK
jgi:hypothetical protein